MQRVVDGVREVDARDGGEEEEMGEEEEGEEAWLAVGEEGVSGCCLSICLSIHLMSLRFVI